MNKIKTHIKKNKYLLIATLLSLFLGFFIFGVIIHKHIPTDIQTHANFIKIWINEDVIIANFGYYLVVYIFSGFCIEPKCLSIASILVLSFSIGLKFLSSYIVANKVMKNNEKYSNYKIVFLFILLLLLIVHPVITPLDFSTDKFYLGKAAINIWHNSTTIFVMPFVILLFYYSYLYLQNPKTKYVIIIVFIGLINVLIKPSFVLSFYVVFPFLILYKYRITKHTIKVFSGLFVLGVIILAEYYFIYQTGGNKIYKGETSGIAIAPFKIFNHYSENLLIDIVSSIIFPFFLYFLYFKKMRKIFLLNYSWLLFIVSLIIGFLFVETGYRMWDGNFTWQIPMANYLLYLTSTTLFFRLLITKKNKFEIKDFILVGLFALHFISGVLYIGRLLILHTYS